MLYLFSTVIKTKHLLVKISIGVIRNMHLNSRSDLLAILYFIRPRNSPHFFQAKPPSHNHSTTLPLHHSPTPPPFSYSTHRRESDHYRGNNKTAGTDTSYRRQFRYYSVSNTTALCGVGLGCGEMCMSGELFGRVGIIGKRKDLLGFVLRKNVLGGK